MSIILFLVALFVSLLIIRIGAIAFQITGLSASTAMFQALSCFTGTGFTTREAELIVGHRQRRKIACVLMVLGSAGVVTMIATFASSLNASNLGVLSHHAFVWDEVAPIIDVILILLVSYGLIHLFLKAKLSRKVNAFLRERVESHFVKRSVLSDYIPVAKDCGLFRVTLRSRGKLRKNLIKVSDMKKFDAQILAIERLGEIIRNPLQKLEVQTGDQLICFGKIEKLEDLMGQRLVGYKTP